jgi:hypothetical protein
MLLFIVVMSPVIEYVDPENAGWTEGFWAFTRHIWWPPAPGPAWFLGVLLAFSAVYAVVRTIWSVLPLVCCSERGSCLSRSHSVAARCIWPISVLMP